VESIGSASSIDYTINNPGPDSRIPDEQEPEDLSVILIPDPNGGIIEPENPVDSPVLAP
jgi:hypothetical protein